MLRKCVLVFFDDMLTYISSFATNCQHLAVVLKLLQNDHWKVKLSKCAFAQTSISYLGHIISAQGIATNLAKLKDIQQWSAPTKTKELCSFLGLANFYRKSVRHYGIISIPLTKLLKKNSLFLWTVQHQRAFDLLKQALISAPVLALPDFPSPFVFTQMPVRDVWVQCSCKMVTL